MSSSEEVIILARLAGTQQFLMNAGEMGAAMKELGLETDMAGAAMVRTTRHGYLMNQALFTVRRVLYGITLATIASGIAAVKWGFDFNNAMQSARVALQPVQDGTFNVNRELEYLFELTKHTPFQFKDMTIAFRQMYLGMRTLGISAQTVNETIKSLVDALSATGRTTPGALNRVAVALQHMAYMGHITGQVVLQLARDGLPIYAALSKELGLTGDQIHNIGKLGIPAQTVLDALNKYIETTPGFANAAYRQSLTFHGLFTTIKDDISQLMGQLETGMFHRLQGRFADLSRWFDNFQSQVKSSANIQEVIGAAFGPGAVMIWQQLAAVVHLFFHELGTVISAIATSKPIWGTLYAALVLLHGILYAIEPLTHLFGGALYFLIPALITYWTVTKVAAFWTGVLRLEEILAVTATKDLTFGQFLLAIMIGRYQIAAKLAAAATWLYTIAQNALFVATEAVSGAFLAARVAAAEFMAVLLFNPITLIVLAVALLVGGLVVLYFKWKSFHDLVNNTFNWIRTHWMLLGAIILGPFTYAAYEIYKNWDGLKRYIMNIVNWILHQIHRITNPIHSLFHRATSWIPGMADGGTVLSPGLSWVGERGPEVMSVPRGASVAPLSALGGGTGNGIFEIHIKPAPVLLDGKKVGDVIFNRYQMAEARA